MASREMVHWVRAGHDWHWLWVKRATISGAAVGGGGDRVGAVPAGADLALRTGRLLAVEADVEVVPPLQ